MYRTCRAGQYLKCCTTDYCNNTTLQLVNEAQTPLSNTPITSQFLTTYPTIKICPFNINYQCELLLYTYNPVYQHGHADELLATDEPPVDQDEGDND